MSTPSSANESYCTFTLAPDVTAGGLPSEEQLAKDLESTDTAVSLALKMTLGEDGRRELLVAYLPYYLPAISLICHSQ